MNGYPISIALILATLAFVGTNYLRAAINHQRMVAFEAAAMPDASLVPAEMDPAFTKKLVRRARGTYERAHRTKTLELTPTPAILASNNETD